MTAGDKGQATIKEFHVEKPGGNAVKLVATERKLSRLEYLMNRQIITPRQETAGTWLAERWAAYFTPGVSSGIEDHAPGSIPADLFARWAKGQTGFGKRGKQIVRVALPPTFRPRKPSAPRRAHDGWSVSRLGALQKWVSANRLLAQLDPMDRAVVVMVAVEGLSFEDVVRRLTGAKSAGGKQREAMKRALLRGLDAIADETEPRIIEIAA